MKLIIGLGNPEPRYKGTRHNAGFTVTSAWASSHGVAELLAKPRFKALLTELIIGSEKVIVAQPTTYYNLVGESFRLLSDYYAISPSDTLIVADDIALPFGTIRTRQGGSDGGNNGIKSINAHGGEATHRLRIGIANELRERIDDADFVLNKFTADERKTLHEHVLPHVATIVDDFISGEHKITSYKLPQTD